MWEYKYTGVKYIVFYMYYVPKTFHNLTEEKREENMLKEKLIYKMVALINLKAHYLKITQTKS